MDDSKFNLWRATFSFCFVDGFLKPEEQKYIEEKLKTLKFTDGQKTILMKDLVSPPNFASLIPLITKPADRSFIVNHVRMLANIDNELTGIEKQKIENVLQTVLSKVDMPGLNKVVADDEKASYHEDEVYKLDSRPGYSEKVIKSLLKLLNPGDYKFPEE